MFDRVVDVAIERISATSAPVLRLSSLHELARAK